MQEKGELPTNRIHRMKRKMWRKVNEIFSSACAIISRESRSALSPVIASCRCQVYVSWLDARDYRTYAHSYVYLPCRLEPVHHQEVNVPLDLRKAHRTVCFCPYLRAHAPLQVFWGFSGLFFIPLAVKERAKLCAESQRWWTISLRKLNTEFSYLL